jgi:hypothetical protein
MVTSLKQSEAIANIAHLLYDFLPGSGRPDWKGHVTFASIARKLGLGHYWPEGSKEPAIRQLLRMTLEREPLQFEKLILEIVDAGIPYCKKNGKPMRSSQIKELNGYLVELGFKFPALWDKDLWSSLDGDSTKRAQNIVETELRSEELQASELASPVCSSSAQRDYRQPNRDHDRRTEGVLFKLLTPNSRPGIEGAKSMVP